MNQEFKAFDKVLVREDDLAVWWVAWFSHYTEDAYTPFAVNSGVYSQCIPFEGNETLAGTNGQPKPKPRWRAQAKQLYYYVTTLGGVSTAYEFHNDFDDTLYRLGNYFQNAEDAEIMAKKFRQLLKDNNS